MRCSLFNSQDSSLLFKHYLGELKKEVNSKSNDYVLNVNVEEWKEYFTTKYDFLPLTIYPEHATVVLRSKGTIKKEDEFGDTYAVETYQFEISIPFTGSSFLFTLKPSSRSVSHPDAEIPSADSGNVGLLFTLHGQNEKQFESEKKRLISAITDNVPKINYDLEVFEKIILTTFDEAYSERKEKALAEKSFFEKLNLDIASDTDKIYKVPLLEKKKIPEPIVDKQSTKKYTEYPLLPDEFYHDILDVIYIFFKAVEKKPSTYKIKDEEALRDYVLPSLETRYNNVTVTGETFNKGGSTDILLRYKDGTNLFVAECKFWKGDASLHSTINQLFDKYLTWRDSKVAIIFFVENKDFSKVLETITESIVKHPYFIRNNGTRGESSFSYIFHFPTDNNKHVFTEIMAFHFPS